VKEEQEGKSDCKLKEKKSWVENIAKLLE
jgi:hypothetical protein